MSHGGFWKRGVRLGGMGGSQYRGLAGKELITFRFLNFIGNMGIVALYF